MKIVFTLSWIREPGLLILLNTQCIRIQVYKTLVVSLTHKLSSLDYLQPSTREANPLCQSPQLTFQQNYPTGKFRNLKAARSIGQQLWEKSSLNMEPKSKLAAISPHDPRSVLRDLISALLLPLCPSLSNTWSQIYKILPPSCLPSPLQVKEPLFNGMFLRAPAIPQFVSDPLRIWFWELPCSPLDVFRLVQSRGTISSLSDQITLLIHIELDVSPNTC